MSDLILENLNFYKILQKSANNHYENLFLTALNDVTNDSKEFLNYIHRSFPSFRNEELQHSWKLLKCLEHIIAENSLKSLNDVEIYALIISAAFHDVGIIEHRQDKGLEKIRNINLKRSKELITEYLRRRLSLKDEYIVTLTNCIYFIIESQTLTWEEMISNDIFRKVERITDQKLRTNIITILFRIGDLLDIDSERSCNVFRKRNVKGFDDSNAKICCKMNHHVIHSIINQKQISVKVEAQNKEEHILWSEWFGYLKQDIYHANTSIFTGELKIFQLSVPNLKIEKSSSSNYDIWALRFELDEKGRIWDIVSQAIYTSSYDFLREIIQNAIDATLFRIYDDETLDIPSTSPRVWQFDNYHPQVILLFSEKEKFLEIHDNGIGMDENALQFFLFKIAQTGYEQIEKKRDFQFPAIAKFGIGFISILLRAHKVIIKTKSINSRSNGRKITLHTEARNAYIEITECNTGTTIQLFLKDKYSAKEIIEYLKNNYRYPSVPIFYIDYDKFTHLMQMAHGLKTDIPPVLENLYLDKSYVDSEIIYKEYQNSIMSVQNSITKELGIDNHKSDETSLQLNDICLSIYSKEILEDVLESPFLLYLDNWFDIIKIVPSTELKKSITSMGLIFIPISFTNFEIGIEWKSIHGFLIHNNEIKKSIIRYSGIAEEFDDPDKMIFLSREELEDEDNYDSETIIIDTVDVIRKYHDDQKRLNDISSRSLYNNYEEIFLVNDFIMTIVDEFDDHPTAFVDKKGSRIRKENSGNDDYYNYLYHMITDYNNDVFQDGIKIPVKAWSIAPFGMCRAICNLTGDARLELNVTRNLINESPVLISKWVNSVGSKIHFQIINTLANIFDKLDYCYKIDNLIPHRNSEPNVLYDHSVEMIINEKVSSF